MQSFYRENDSLSLSIIPFFPSATSWWRTLSSRPFSQRDGRFLAGPAARTSNPPRRCRSSTIAPSSPASVAHRCRPTNEQREEKYRLDSTPTADLLGTSPSHLRGNRRTSSRRKSPRWSHWIGATSRIYDYLSRARPQLEGSWAVASILLYFSTNDMTIFERRDINRIYQPAKRPIQRPNHTGPKNPRSSRVNKSALCEACNVPVDPIWERPRRIWKMEGNSFFVSFPFYPVPANRSTPPVSLRRELEVRMNAYLPDPERVSGQRLARRVDDVIAEGHLDLTRRRPEQG